MPVPYSGQGNGGDAEVGCNIMLRNASYNVGVFSQQLFIPLLRCVLYAGKEQLLIHMKTLDKFLLIHVPQGRLLLDKPIKIVRSDYRQLRGFNTFQGEQTRLPLVQAIERGHKIALEEKLESDVFPVIVEKESQTPLVNQIQSVGHFPLLQQDVLGRDGKRGCIYQRGKLVS